jgi:hypothetical protein
MNSATPVTPANEMTVTMPLLKTFAQKYGMNGNEISASVLTPAQLQYIVDGSRKAALAQGESQATVDARFQASKLVVLHAGYSGGQIGYIYAGFGNNTSVFEGQLTKDVAMFATGELYQHYR